MSEIALTLEVSTNGGDALKELRRRLTDTREALDEGGAVLLEGVREAFDAGDRGEWQALAQFTVSERTRLGFGGEHPILIRTGEYLSSFQVDDGEENAVGIASDDPRFDTLNYGGVTETGHRVPPRPVIISEEFIERAIEAIWQEIVKE